MFFPRKPPWRDANHRLLFRAAFHAANAAAVASLRSWQSSTIPARIEYQDHRLLSFAAQRFSEEIDPVFVNIVEGVRRQLVARAHLNLSQTRPGLEALDELGIQWTLLGAANAFVSGIHPFRISADVVEIAIPVSALTMAVFCLRQLGWTVTWQTPPNAKAMPFTALSNGQTGRLRLVPVPDTSPQYRPFATLEDNASHWPVPTTFALLHHTFLRINALSPDDQWIFDLACTRPWASDVVAMLKKQPMFRMIRSEFDWT